MLEKIGGEPKEDMLDLVQIESNLQFIKLFQSETPPSLESEAKSLAEQEASLAGAHKVFAKLIADLKDVLTAPLENAATSVGVHNHSGTKYTLDDVTSVASFM